MSERVEEVWLVRHGVTSSNKARLIQGHTDIPLDEQGEQQARALGRWLEERGESFDAVVASPLRRARRTAELLDVAAPEAIRLDERWMECSYGDLEGQPAEQLRELRSLPDEQAAAAAPPNGESLDQMSARVAAAFDDWSSQEIGRRLLVVTHGGPIASVVCRCFGTRLAPTTSVAFRRDNTGLFVFRRRSSRPETFQLALLNGTAHLRS